MISPRPLAPTSTVWVNCSAGVAGDMLLAALIDAGADRLAVMDAWAALGLDGFTAMWERVDRCGVGALWTNIAIVDPGSHDGHSHDPDSGHHTGHRTHPHRRAGDVLALIERSDLPERVATNAARVYRTLAAVEGAIHGVDPNDVELHEVGALDSILDVVGVCAALDDLDIDELTYSAIGLGTGIVDTAHGSLPHPAPATSRLIAAASAPVCGVDTTMETATPTGVAVLTVLGAASLASPTMTVTADGFGAGTANPASRANVVHVLVGTRDLVDAGDPAVDRVDVDESLFEIETNVDDVTGEVIAYTIERLLEAGAADAWATPIIMKKRRPAVTMHALATPALLGVLRDILLAETGSLGVRVRPVGRWVRPRTPMTVSVDGHQIAVKVAPGTITTGNVSSGHELAGRYKIEYADAARVARATGRPLRDVLSAAEVAVRLHESSADR